MRIPDFSREDGSKDYFPWYYRKRFSSNSFIKIKDGKMYGNLRGGRLAGAMLFFQVIIA